MNHNQQPPFLRVPADIRHKIFQQLFQDSNANTIRLKMFARQTDTELSGSTESVGTKLVDGGITLTNRLVRQESMHVLEITCLDCEFEEWFYGPIDMSIIKPQFLQTIRTLRINLQPEVGDWDIPYASLPALELVQWEYLDAETVQGRYPFHDGSAFDENDMDKNLAVMAKELKETYGTPYDSEWSRARGR